MEGAVDYITASSGSNKHLKIFWVFWLLVTFAAFLWISYYELLESGKGKTVFHVRLEPATKLPVPGITMCPSNWLSRSSLQNQPRLRAIEAMYGFLIQNKRRQMQTNSTDIYWKNHSSVQYICPDGWPLVGSMCYYADEARRLPFFDTKTACGDLGGRTPEFPSRAECDSFKEWWKSSADRGDNIFIGLLAQNGKGSKDPNAWQWSTNSSALTFTDWSQGTRLRSNPQPENESPGSSYCVRMRRSCDDSLGCWFDTNCFRRDCALLCQRNAVIKRTVSDEELAQLTENFRNSSVHIPLLDNITIQGNISEINDDEQKVLYTVAAAADVNDTASDLTINSQSRNALYDMISMLEPAVVFDMFDRYSFAQTHNHDATGCTPTMTTDPVVVPTNGACKTIKLDLCGHRYGEWVSLFLRVDAGDVIPTTQSSGIRIYIHDIDDVPQSVPGVSVPFGFDARIVISTAAILHLNNRGLKCLWSYPTTSYNFFGTTKYSETGCQIGCKQKMVIEHCGCVDCRMGRIIRPKNVTENGTECCNREQSSCVTAALEKVPPDVCGCYKKCAEALFSTSSSYSRRPVHALKCQGMESNRPGGNCRKAAGQESGTITITSSEIVVEVLYEAVCMNVDQLVSNIAGLLCILLGLSVASLACIICRISVLILLNARMICRRRNRPRVATALVPAPVLVVRKIA